MNSMSNDICNLKEKNEVLELLLKSKEEKKEKVIKVEHIEEEKKPAG